MSYIGRTTNKSSDIRRFNATSSTSATHTLTWTAPNEQSLLVTINGVKQQEDAYSVSGTILTLTSALVSTDKLEVIGINDIGTVITPAQNSVDTDKIQDDAVDTDKIQDDAVTADKLSATGTSSSSTYLRGDMVWGIIEGSEITSQNTFFKNPNTVTNSQTTTIASTANAALIGPIGINSGVVWAIAGTLKIL